MNVCQRGTYGLSKSLDVIFFYFHLASVECILKFKSAALL